MVGRYRLSPLHITSTYGANMPRITHTAISLLACSFLLSGSETSARLLSVTIGDMDGGIYNGIDSADDVYVDAAWLDQLQNPTIVDFDIGSHDHVVPFTFEWAMQPYEAVTGAFLTVAIRGTDNKVNTDSVRLETLEDEGKYTLTDLGWLPVPTNQIVIRSMNLSNALSRNLLPELQDGQLNGNIGDDTLIDYARLDLTISPIGDLDEDGFVGINDLGLVLGAWNQSAPLDDERADPTGDGFVGIDDLNPVLGYWNTGVPPAGKTHELVPEPMALGPIALLGLVGLSRRTAR